VKAIVSASQSPRRQQILKTNILADKIDFQVLPSTFKEDFDTSKYHGKAKELVVEYAKHKAIDVKQQIIRNRTLSPVEHSAATILIIGCDTVIEQDGVILEKPTSEEEAKTRILSYSQNTHSVLSGVYVVCITLDAANKVVSETTESFFSETEVTFADLDEELVQAYVDTKEPMDKAGGYGIQEIGATLIQKINGCYYNVVGLPVHSTSAAMYKLLSPHVGADS